MNVWNEVKSNFYSVAPFFMYLKSYLFIFTILCVSFLKPSLVCNAQGVQENSKLTNLPQQLPPPVVEVSEVGEEIFNFGPSTNLIRVLQEIRDLSESGKIEDAQKMAASAIEKIEENEENKFYLNQIRKEETKLYFNLAQEAMAAKQYSLASQLFNQSDIKAEEPLQNNLRRINTDLPEDFNPKTASFAWQLRQKYPSDHDLIQALLRQITQEEFFYTLNFRNYVISFYIHKNPSTK